MLQLSLLDHLHHLIYGLGVVMYHAYELVSLWYIDLVNVKSDVAPRALPQVISTLILSCTQWNASQMENNICMRKNMTTSKSNVRYSAAIVTI